MSEVQGRPPGTMSAERRYGIAISVALILGGVYWALTGLTDDSKTSQGSYPVQDGAVTIQAASADLELHAGDVSEIAVDRRYNRNLFGSEPKEKYSDGKLQLKDTGCGFLTFGCDTHYVITVPKELKVTIQSSSGDLKVSQLPAGVTLQTSSGAIEFDHIGGEVSLKSSSGDISGENLSATAVTAQSSSGDVELSFDLAPETIDAQTSSGDVDLRLPTGPETYKVDADSNSGDESVNIRTDPESTHLIKAKSSSGDTTVEYNN